MTSRIVCVGDTHLRSAHPRNAQRLAALDQVIAAGLALEELAAWAWVGDLFDTDSTVEDRLAVASRLRTMADRAPVFIPRGNHDGRGDLLIFAMLATRFPIIVCETTDVVTTTLATGHVATVFLLAYPEEGGLVAAGTPIADIPDVARQLLDTIFIDAGAKLEAARARGELTAFFAHANIYGAVSSTGQPSGWTDIVVDAALLTRLGDCPKVLGHIHKPQDIAGAVYAGSISRNTVGEVEDKRFLVVEFPDAHSWVARSYPIDVPAIWHVETAFVKGEPFVYRWTAGPDGEPLEPPVSLKGCEVRVRVTCPKSERMFYEMAKPHILADFADCKLSIEPIFQSDSALRSVEVAAARTLREKVAAWASVTGTVLPAAVLDKLDLLERSTPDAVLSDVRATIGALLDASEEREVAVA